MTNLLRSCIIRVTTDGVIMTKNEAEELILYIRTEVYKSMQIVGPPKNMHEENIDKGINAGISMAEMAIRAFAK